MFIGREAELKFLNDKSNGSAALRIAGRLIFHPLSC